MKTSVLSCVVAAALLGCIAASSLATTDFPMMVPLTMLEPEEFPILPWGHTPGDLDTLKELRACGFNLAGFVSPQDLDVVREAGLKGIVSDATIQADDPDVGADEAQIDQRVTTVVERFGQHPAAFGYYLKDEPGAKLFGVLGKWVEAFRSTAPQACTYINLFANGASAGQMGVSIFISSSGRSRVTS